MADQTDDGLIREVDEELREEQMKRLWQRYGKFVVGTAVLIVAIVAGNQIWQSQQLSARSEDSAKYFDAQLLAASGNTQEALKAMQTLAGSASTGYGVLAQFQEAALMAESGDHSGASQLYQHIARDTLGDVALSGLANVMSAMVEVNAGGYDRAALEFRLGAMSENTHPYRFSARELLALIAMEHGDSEKAKAVLNALIDDQATPQNLRLRAQSMLQGLGS
ncbi:tetratricopeptide repeat protein [Magnetovibrio sp. PR-2]|uniref:DUF2659 family protein n=1 Tax=Magnetovibrio sp. PR-2 TaxID=3120356 RepID=UPI002FCE3FE9